MALNGAKMNNLCLLYNHGNYLDEKDRESCLVLSASACLKSNTKEITDLRPSPLTSFAPGPIILSRER